MFCPLFQAAVTCILIDHSLPSISIYRVCSFLLLLLLLPSLMLFTITLISFSLHASLLAFRALRPQQCQVRIAFQPSRWRKHLDSWQWVVRQELLWIYKTPLSQHRVRQTYPRKVASSLSAVQPILMAMHPKVLMAVFVQTYTYSFTSFRHVWWDPQISSGLCQKIRRARRQVQRVCSWRPQAG